MRILKISPTTIVNRNSVSPSNLYDINTDDKTMLYQISSDSAADKDLDIESLSIDLSRHMLNVLNSTEIFVLRNYYGIGCPKSSLEVISSKIGKTRERARQLHVQALSKLRNSPYSTYLAMHLSA